VGRYVEHVRGKEINFALVGVLVKLVTLIDKGLTKVTSNDVRCWIAVKNYPAGVCTHWIITCLSGYRMDMHKFHVLAQPMSRKTVVPFFPASRTVGYTGWLVNFPMTKEKLKTQG